MTNAIELAERVRRGESVPIELVKSAINELRAGRASAAQSTTKTRKSKSAAATADAVELLRKQLGGA